MSTHSSLLLERYNESPERAAAFDGFDSPVSKMHLSYVNSASGLSKQRRQEKEEEYERTLRRNRLSISRGHPPEADFTEQVDPTRH